MRIKIIFIAVIFFSLFSIAVSFGIEKEAQKSPSAFFPANSYEFEQVVDGSKVMHDFIIQNKGTAPLIIEKVKTG